MTIIKILNYVESSDVATTFIHILTDVGGRDGALPGRYLHNRPAMPRPPGYGLHQSRSSQSQELLPRWLDPWPRAARTDESKLISSVVFIHEFTQLNEGLIPPSPLHCPKQFPDKESSLHKNSSTHTKLQLPHASYLLITVPFFFGGGGGCITLHLMKWFDLWSKPTLGKLVEMQSLLKTLHKMTQIGSWTSSKKW